MAKHTISEAAKLAGKSRSTLYNHVNEGRISADFRENGDIVVDTSELIRAYGSLENLDADLTVQVGQVGRNLTSELDSLHKAEIERLQDVLRESLERRVRELEKEREEWKAQADYWRGQAERTLRLLEPPQRKSSFWERLRHRT